MAVTEKSLKGDLESKINIDELDKVKEIETIISHMRKKEYYSALEYAEENNAPENVCDVLLRKGVETYLAEDNTNTARLLILRYGKRDENEERLKLNIIRKDYELQEKLKKNEEYRQRKKEAEPTLGNLLRRGKNFLSKYIPSIF